MHQQQHYALCSSPIPTGLSQPSNGSWLPGAQRDGFAPDVIERQLAHQERNAVRAAYNRAEYLARIIHGGVDFLEVSGD
jgi:hypothetical protein